MTDERHAVVIDRPYYPSITVYPGLLEATEAAAKLMEEEMDEDGKHKSTVYVVRIVAEAEIKTSY